MKLKTEKPKKHQWNQNSVFRKDNEITNTKNKGGDISIDPTDIKRKIREYDEKLYANKFDSLDKMDQFPKKHRLPKLTKYNPCSPVSINETKLLV